ncbi:helix-turn-helix domain-containing protein [Micromonospora sp. MS34]|uniref:helix-turn-helix domain-containing protein n=1 Tax=Micromonospora sp. MS34 TaxID=3385971 RepID=UPI0039A3E741
MRAFFSGSAIGRNRIDVPSRFRSRIATGSAGDLRVCSLKSVCQPGSRSEAARHGQTTSRGDVAPAVFLVLQASGTSAVVQYGREAVLGPGSFALLDTTATYEQFFPGGHRQSLIQIPHSALGVGRPLLRDAAARPVSAGASPISGLVASYFSRLISQPDLRQGPHASSVAEVGVQLLTSLLAAEFGGSAPAVEALHETLSVRIMAYLRHNLTDPGLCAERVARVHNISVRYLYVLLAREGVTLGEWIRTRRLAAARDELASPRARWRTIAAIANSWGFADATHFSKIFRQAYGMTPRTWRAVNQQTKA